MPQKQDGKGCCICFEICLHTNCDFLWFCQIIVNFVKMILFSIAAELKFKSKKQKVKTKTKKHFTHNVTQINVIN